MEKVRSFIAIELPAELKQGLAQLQARLKVDNQPGIKWANPNDVHLTLKFLGNISPTIIDQITRGITNAAQKIPPFTLYVQQLGAFPSLKPPLIATAALVGELDKLSQLQKLLESSLSGLGFAPEPRSFKPHLTLARLRSQATPDERQRLGELIASTRFETGQGIKVNSINLMKSQLTRDGPIYSKLSSAGFKKEPLL